MNTIYNIFIIPLHHFVVCDDAISGCMNRQRLLRLLDAAKGKSHIALNPSQRCLTCGAKWTFCRTGPKNL